MSEILDEFQEDQYEIKSRHGCVTAWLWLGIISSGLTALFYTVGGDLMNQGLEMQGEQPLSFMVMIAFSILSLAGLVGYYMITQWKKKGFYIVCAISLITGISAFLFMSEMTSIVGAFLGPLVLYAILQIQKDGVTAWNHLE